MSSKNGDGFSVTKSSQLTSVLLRRVLDRGNPNLLEFHQNFTFPKARKSPKVSKRRNSNQSDRLPEN